MAAETLRWLPREGISRALGRVASIEPPRVILDRAIGLYVRAYRVDLSDCEVPERGFRSFNEFFSRPLREGARPLDADPDAMLCPADGKLEDEGPIEEGASFRVKGRRYDVGELLGSATDAGRFAGGRFAVVYLSPRDYHRVHAPVAGRVTHARHIGGTLFPVNRIGLEHVPNLFAKNERIAVHQRSERHGEVVTILVGAMVVGGIALAFDPAVRSNQGTALGERRYDDVTLARGDELGRFLLGSTAIVLTTSAARATPALGVGGAVRMGQALYRVREGVRA
ncbi:MAG: archaetidylserine decarboxylase [Sandaracinaceae bacterium]|nr:archaetidylserine decarboxylase [Sandaracinaceae bacterium]